MKQQNDVGLKMLYVLFLLSASYVCYGGDYLPGQERSAVVPEPRLSGGLSFVERCYAADEPIEESEPKVYKVPSIDLNPEDCQFPENWNKRVVSALKYDLFEDVLFPKLVDAPSFGRYAELQRMFFSKRYDDVIAFSKRLIEETTSQNFPDNLTNDLTRLSNFRNYFYTWALALELKGNSDEAERLCDAAFLGPDKARRWIKIRLDYARFSSSEERDLVSWHDDFLEICRLVTESEFYPVFDDAFRSVVDNMTAERQSDPPPTWNIPCSISDPFYQSAFLIYQFRDNCAKVVNPALHFMYAGNQENLVFLTRKSYAVFLEFMEEYYREWQAQSQAAREQNGEDASAPEGERRNEGSENRIADSAFPPNIPEYVDRAMEILRKIGEVPY